MTSGGTFNPHLHIEVVIPHPGTGHQAVAPLDDATYLWRVIARDRALNTASSLVQPFRVAASLSNVEGRVLLQGRGPAGNAGTEVTLFQNRVQVGPPLLTRPDGSFAVELGLGDYNAAATHPGWLSDTLFFSIDGSGVPVNLGETRLPAGDADNNVDRRDLRLFQRGLNRAQRPGIFTDVNGDGITDVVDMAYAGRNIGRRGLAPVAAPAGMISWWPADGNDGALLNGATFTGGKVGQAFSFDGVDDRVEVPDAPNLGGMSQLSIDAWIYRSGQILPPVVAPGLVTKWGPGGVEDDSYFLRLTVDGRLWGAIQGSARVDLFESQTQLDYHWTHVALVYDGSKLRLYVNGALDASTPAVVGPINNGTFPLLIGRNDDSQNPGTFLGLIDEVEIFNRALSTAEIRSIFEAGPAGKVKPEVLPPTEVFPPAAGVLAKFKFNGDTIDSSGNGRDATLIGGEFVPTTFDLGLHVFLGGPMGIDWSAVAGLLVHPYTVEMVLTPTDTTNFGKIFSFDDTNDNGWYYGEQGFQDFPSPLVGVGQVLAGEQHYFAFVSTAPDQIDIFFQGVFLGSNNTSFLAPPSQAIFFRDDTVSGRLEQLDAVVEALRISGVTRTPQEIAAIQQRLGLVEGPPEPQPVQPPVGMISWWPGDGNAHDIVDGNDGVLSGDAPFALGKVGQGFSFDGTGDLVLVSGDNANLNILGDVTVDLWAKRTAFSSVVPFATMVIKGAGVIGIVQTPDVPIAFGLFFDDDDRLTGVFEPAGGSNVFVVGPPVTDTNFHHYAYVRMGNSHKLFMDGVMVSTDIFAEGPGDTSGLPLTIGAIRTDETPTGFRHHIAGVIDELEVFDRALADAEIRAIFEAGSAGKIKPQPVEPPAGMVSWWPGDGNAQDIMDGNDGILSGDATATADGKVGQAFSFDGTGDFVFVPASSNLNVGTGSGLTIDAWINSPDVTLASPLVEWNNGSSPGVHFWTSVPVNGGGAGALFANIVDIASSDHFLTSPPGVLTSNTFEHVAVTYDKTTGFATLYVNGEVVANVDLGIFTPSTNFDSLVKTRFEEVPAL